MGKNDAMNILIARRRKSAVRLISENGKGRLAPIETENAGDTEASPRVVDGGADGGKGRDGPQSTSMNSLIRDQTARSKGTITVDA